MRVAITRELVSSVRNNCQHFKSLEMSDVPAEDMLVEKIRQKLNPQSVADACWGQHLPLRDQMPAEWCIKADGLSIIVVFEGGEQPQTINFRTVQSPTKILMPPGSGACWPTVQINSTHALFDPMREEMDEIIANRTRRAEINKRWNETAAQVTTFLTSQKSLNTALKVWPGVERFVEKRFIDRVNEKEPPREKKEKLAREAVEAELNVDFDALEAAGVMGKLMTGK